MSELYKILLIAAIMLPLDGAYIYAMNDIFKQQITNVQRVVMKFRMLGAVICYILMVLGLYYFVVRPRASVVDAFFLGVLINGVYDTTNYATLKRWDAKFAVVDTVWGGVLMAPTTYLVRRVLSK
jgi:uncharacterized membrane protein